MLCRKLASWRSADSRSGRRRIWTRRPGITVLLCDTVRAGRGRHPGRRPSLAGDTAFGPARGLGWYPCLVLSGGSAFGLDAAGGVMRYLEERGIGFDTGVTRVPLVCQSCRVRSGDRSDGRASDAAMAYAACRTRAGMAWRRAVWARERAARSASTPAQILP